MIIICIERKKFKGEEEIKAKAEMDLGREVDMNEIFDFELAYEDWRGGESDIKARNDKEFWKKYWNIE